MDVYANLVKPTKEVNFPNELNPAKKGRDYCLQMMQATYFYNWNISSGRNAFGNPRRNDWLENRQWADGNPNVNKFAPMFSDLKNGSNETVSYLNLDLKPVCYIPKFMDVAINYAYKADYTISARAINPLATDMKEEEKWKMYVNKKLEGWKQMMEAEAGMPLGNMPELEFDFNDKRELDILYEMSQKMAAEVEMEIGNEVILNESDWPMLKRMFLKDLFTCGAYAPETYTEPSTGRIRHRYVDLCNMIYPPFRGEYLETPERIGYVTTRTIAQLRLEAGNQLSDADYIEIARMYANFPGNSAFAYPNSFNYQYVNSDNAYNYWYNFQVPVMVLYWEELDKYKYKDETALNGETYTKPIKFGNEITITSEWLKTEAGKEWLSENYSEADPSGEKRIGRRITMEEEDGEYEYTVRDGSGRKKKKKVYSQTVHKYYQAYWIPGSNYIWNYGPVPNMSRNAKNPSKATCPIKLVRPYNKSILERLLPMEEQNILAWYKFQNTIAKAVPAGYSFNISTAENMMVDGKSFPVKHQVALYEQTGRLLWKSEDAFDPQGRPLPHPIMQLPSTLVNDIDVWLKIFETNYIKMQEASGINDILAASNPNPRQGAATSQLALESSQNSLYLLNWAIVFGQCRMCEDATEKLKLSVMMNGDYTNYSSAIGRNLLQSAITTNILPFTYAIDLTAMPTEQERLDLKETARMAVINPTDPVKGGLLYNDYIRICDMLNRGDNLRIIEAFMNYRIQKNLERMQQLQNENSQVQAQANQDNLLAASQAKEKEMVVASQLKQQEIITQGEVNAQLEQVKSANRTQNQIDVANVKSVLKKNEKVHEAFLNFGV